MSFFRRPEDTSSEDDSSDTSDEEIESSINDISQNSAIESNGSAEHVERELPADTLSHEITRTISDGEDGTLLSREAMRDMAMASLLEELTRYKAAELMNAANVGNGGQAYDKDSPEVQPYANALYAQSSRLMQQGGLLSAQSTKEDNRDRRQNFMTGLSTLSYRAAVDDSRKNSTDRDSISPGSSTALTIARRDAKPPMPFQNTVDGQVQQLNWEMGNINIVRRPSSEIRWTPLQPSFSMPSRYHTNFHEQHVIGRGGFGRVYKALNIFDNQIYAIKKVPLSPRLARQYREQGHTVLEQILREAQALARLEHPNVVRYFATWLEEPASPNSMMSGASASQKPSWRGQLLLQDKSAAPDVHTYLPQDSRPIGHSAINFGDPFLRRDREAITRPVGRILNASSEEVAEDSFDPFARSGDFADQTKKHELWSSHPSRAASQSKPHDDVSTNIFTDDGVDHASSVILRSEASSSHILYMQMSVYPLTLAEYLTPTTMNRRSSRSINTRHCFHIIPAVRLLLSILCGLQYIHSQGLLHRDIKPSNIFLSEVEAVQLLPQAIEHGHADVGSCPSCPMRTARLLNPRIGDFGLVAELTGMHASEGDHASAERGSSDINRPVGTEFYRPPVHESSRSIADERLDVFALGVIMLEMLWKCATRMERIELLRTAQEGRSTQSLHEKVLQEGYSGRVSSQLERVVSGMIDPHPERRWRCRMVKDGLEAVLSQIAEERIARTST